ncbi:MAG: hypothetical protein H6813_04305 [Phycisphaeraceae bacterium]|nr:hypothetical protein [Phycisphaeraceae bacterium]MCB9847170.1 hypothetical protein [Phycisphaeraceae bacterium]
MFRRMILSMTIGSVAAAAHAGVGEELSRLTASDGAASDRLGQAVAISGTNAVVGAPLDDDLGADSGSAYFFDVLTGLESAKLTASDGAAGDQFGFSVGISGTTAIVGAPFEDESAADAGAVYVFDRISGLELMKLLAGDGDSGDAFGHAVAIDGTTAIIGAPQDNELGADAGAVYVFSTLTGQQLFKLTPGDGAAGDRFGGSVAISGTLAVIGSALDDDNGGSSGSAYVFDIRTGQELHKLLPDDGAGNDQFGCAVAISGTGVVVGAYHKSDNGTWNGAAYSFDARSGQQLQRFDPGFSIGALDQFGVSVAASGTTALIGANKEAGAISGSGAVFYFDMLTGEMITKAYAAVGVLNDNFGIAVALDGSTALIGADFADDQGDASGAAYFFDVGNRAACPGAQIAEYPATPGAQDPGAGNAVAIDATTAIVGSWYGDIYSFQTGAAYLYDVATGEQRFKLRPDDQAIFGFFGISVGVDGPVAIVGARGITTDVGAAYLFDTATGLQLHRLTPNDGGLNDRFGNSVAIAGSIAVVGSPRNDAVFGSSGAVYVFDVTTGQQLMKIVPNDPAPGDHFGSSVALHGTTLIVGSPDDDDNGSSSGSAYLFDVSAGQQLHKLLPDDGFTDDKFGWSVSVFGDFAIVGAYDANVFGNDSGAAYIFQVSNGQQFRKIAPPDGEAGDYFGESVSMFGDACVIGASADDDQGLYSGSAYLYRLPPGEEIIKLQPAGIGAGDRFGSSVGFWQDTMVVGLVGTGGGENIGASYLFDAVTEQQITRLYSTDGVIDEGFGASVSMIGNLALIGAPGNDDLGPDSGNATLLDTRTGGFLRLFDANDGAPGDRFGEAVAISGGGVIAGAAAHSDNGADSGAAYLFDLWSGDQIAKLLPGDNAAGDRFGVSVGLDDSFAIVGASGDDDNGADSGSAYLFNAVTGAQTAKLLAADGAAGDSFGASADLHGTIAIIGAPGDDDQGAESGSAYVFDAVSGAPLHKLLASAGGPGDLFGSSIALHGTLAIVGAPGDGVNGPGSGSASVFDAVTGAELHRLIPGDGSVGDGFGSSVAIHGTIVVVGAGAVGSPGDQSGSAYYFDAITGQELGKLNAIGGGAFANFGSAVAITGTNLFVGAAAFDEVGLDAGASYLFDAAGGLVGCVGDLNGDGVIDTADLGSLIGVFGGSSPAGDLNCDGVVDTADLGIMLGLFGSACN